MDTFILIEVCIYSLIFLTTSVTKLVDTDKHITSIEDYRILQKNLVIPFFYMDIVSSLIAGIGILLSSYAKILSILIMIVLLVIYTTALVIHLFNKRNDLSCGCGGILGDHMISWKLVVRNSLLILNLFIVLFLVLRFPHSPPYSITVLTLLMMASIVYLFRSFIGFYNVSKEFKRIKG